MPDVVVSPATTEEVLLYAVPSPCCVVLLVSPAFRPIFSLVFLYMPICFSQEVQLNTL